MTETDHEAPAKTAVINDEAAILEPAERAMIKSEQPFNADALVSTPHNIEELNLNDPSHFINRELSHLYFNQRVFAQSLNSETPLLERLKFLLICSSNLDEFFEIRVAGLMQRIKFERETTEADGLQTREILQKISEITHTIVDEQYRVLNDILIPELAKENIEFLRRNEWSKKQAKWVETYFTQEILPIISPIGLDPAHPFPRLVNKGLNFIVDLDGKDAFGRNLGLAIVPAPRSLPRLIPLPTDEADHHHFVFLSSMIHDHADKLFPGMTVKGCYQFRITRNGDLDLDIEGIADLARALRGELHSRRFGTAVRLEVADNTPQDLIDFLLREVDLTEEHLYRVKGPVNLMRLMNVSSYVDRPDLSFPPFTPQIPKGLSRKDSILDAIAKKDYLLHHPYESFTPTIQLIGQAAKDPNVVAIKQTLYRTDHQSLIVDALLDAARHGKEVTAVIEIRARFDEEENLELASRLQEAGVLVVYGVVGYKTHAKMILIVRREGEELRRYCHLGTGNYHSGTSRLYTDYSLFTAEPALCEDVHRVFQQLTGMGKTEKMNTLFHAPFTLKKQLLRLIDGEIKAVQEGNKGYLIIKCNGLTEPKVIQALYKASQAGVKIDLIIRGMCALKVGIPGVSNNIRVFSIIGRFLEHTRAYYFENATPSVYCASADLMERNLNRRVETFFPISQSDLAQRIKSDLELYINDGQQSWEQQADGTYALRDKPNNPAAQTELLRQLTGQTI